MDWLDSCVARLEHPECVESLPNHLFHPEDQYLYQKKHSHRFEPLNDKKHKRRIEERSKKEIDTIIDSFDPVK